MHKVPPQLEVAYYVPQLVWLAISFLLLYLLLSRIALPRIETVLEERKTRISGDLEGAREARLQSEKALERYEAEIAAAKARGQGTIRAGREKLEAELNGKRSSVEQQLAAKSAEAEEKVKSFLQRASGEIVSMTADAVGDIVKELGSA